MTYTGSFWLGSFTIYDFDGNQSDEFGWKKNSNLTVELGLNERIVGF